MRADAGQFYLDGDEVAILGLAQRIDVLPHRDDDRFSATAGRWRFCLAATRNGKVEGIYSPFCFRNEADAQGYGEATLRGARAAIEKIRTTYNTD